MTELKIDEKEFIETKMIIKDLLKKGLRYDAIIETIVNDGYENWYPIEDFNNKYSFSNLGRVRNNKTGKILKGRISFVGWGHLAYCLSDNYEKKHYYINDPYACTLDDLINISDIF